ncbi:MAG: NADH-quinone oxidoreductase subunit L [Fuerstiella sp.]|nr:NADH-quinone oxidoreductase subunit L [Fuerstiella sp.]
MVGETLKFWLMIAWLLPLAGFVVEIFFGFYSKNPRHSKAAAWCAVGCIGIGFLCSANALRIWGNANDWCVLEVAEHSNAHADPAHSEETHDADKALADHDHSDADSAKGQTAYSGVIYTLGVFGSLEVTLDYYIDSLTLVMFTMVTLIATCIHLFAIGYMSDELTDEYVDHSAHTADGGHVHRPGRFYRFFAFMSLFCFAMLGLVLAGNIFQVFIFWELVGICSFLLIGFYTERKTASDAANKAFIMNRVGDFGFLIGLMVLWTFFGTFRFGDTVVDDQVVDQGLFSMVHRDNTGNLTREEFTGDVLITDTHGHVLTNEDGSNRQIPYYLMVVVGLGIFAGCVGKSAQFPLQTWLPDAMEGPTPVSALVHSATMVAAGVYLAGRFFPMFVQEVLLTIAYTGCITLFLAATIAMVATDIKKVLAYSTISQLGYMMLGIGVFGWAAGLFHLITHAFFKSLMFLCSGSVIYGCHHEQEMPKMGGLLWKMPITAFTMLVGVCAISGFWVPFGLEFSGYHSKDAIVASALAFNYANPAHFLLFLIPLLTAGITAFYMFRMWFYTFVGKPRDQHVHEHAHESPWVMTVPLVILAVFAWFCAYGGESGRLYLMLTGDEPAHVAAGVTAATAGGIVLPGHDAIHAVHGQAGTWALIAALSGALIAYVLYGTSVVNVEEMKRQLAGVHGFLANKWHFDELYDALFMKPAHKVAAFCAWFDGAVFDRILHSAAKATVIVSKWDRVFDENVVDGFVNLIASATQSVGTSLKVVQTGRLRQYVMFIVLGVVALFAVMFTTFPG